MSAKPVIHIDVVSDVICPWCWIGKRRLEEAMELQKDKYEFVVRWEPFLLRPEMPEEGVARPAGFPSPSALQNIREAGQAVGIDFSLKSSRIPWTVLAHALLEFAKETEGGRQQNDLQEVIFKGYFTDGLLPSRENLLAFAGAVGLDAEAAGAFIQDKANQRKAFDRARHWARQGVTGVPTFYMNGQLTFSGAQEADAFGKTFEQAAAKFANQKLDVPANM